MRRAWILALLLLLIPTGALVAQGPAEQGKQYFMNNGCYGCHTVGRMGTPIGPDLSHVGAKHSRSYLIGWLRDPSSQKPTAHMPKLTLTDTEIQALAAYLGSLR